MAANKCFKNPNQIGNSKNYIENKRNITLFADVLNTINSQKSINYHTNFRICNLTDDAGNKLFNVPGTDPVKQDYQGKIVSLISHENRLNILKGIHIVHGHDPTEHQFLGEIFESGFMRGKIQTTTTSYLDNFDDTDNITDNLFKADDANTGPVTHIVFQENDDSCNSNMDHAYSNSLRTPQNITLGSVSNLINQKNLYKDFKLGSNTRLAKSLNC